MTRLGLVCLSFCFSISQCLFSQNSETSGPVKNETSGQCSPIAPYNQGSITIQCSGLSEKQSATIVNLLRQISTAQAKDQAILLSKLDQILDTVRATQRQATPRAITGEVRQMLLAAAWGACAPEKILILAPPGDNEAQVFASQIKSVFDEVGMQTQIRYKPLGPNNDGTDIRILTNGAHDCSIQYAASLLSRLFTVKLETLPPPESVRTPEELRKYQVDSSVPLLFVVYSKK